MKRRAVIDEGVGETRIAVYEGRHLVELHARRWSDKNMPRLGDVFNGRVCALDPSIGGAFVELGCGPAGLLKFTDMAGKARLSEGRLIQVEIRREAMADKGPVVQFLDLAPTGDAPGPVQSSSLKAALTQRFGGTLTFDHAFVGQLDKAMQRVLAVPGGGDIAIEPTRAGIVIDVDKGRAQSGFDVALAAIPLIMQQLRLRSLGGLIIIDFPNIRQPKQKDRLLEAMQTAAAGDPNLIKIAPLSRFGVMEMTRTAYTRSLDDLMLGPDGHLTVESQAMAALQRLEREARHAGGAQLELRVPAPVLDWLNADNIGWRDAMQARIGARFTLAAGPDIDVVRDR